MNTLSIGECRESDLATLAAMLGDCGDSATGSSIGFALDEAQCRRHSFGDPDFEPGLFLAARDGRDLVGCVLGLRRPWKKGREHTGFVKWLFVRSVYQGSPAGPLLLTACERALIQHGATHLAYGSCAPLYLFPGVPEADHATRQVLAACGWQEESPRISLRASLNATIPPGPAPSADSAAFAALAGPGDGGAVLSFVSAQFSPSWAEEVRPAVTGTRGAFCSLVRDAVTNELLGFAAVNASNPGWFGPMGVAAEQRGRGLGSLLVRHALIDARERGITQLMFPWVNEKEAFYSRVVPEPLERVVFLKATKRP